MAPSKFSKYSPLSPRSSITLEDKDFEANLASDAFLPESGNTKPNSQERISSYERSTRLKEVLSWVRWGVVVLLQMLIVILLLPSNGGLKGLKSLTGWHEESGWTLDMTETGGDVNGLYVPTHKYALLGMEEDKFVPNMTSDVDRMEIRRNWDKLMPLGSGSVAIPDYKQHPMLGQPIVDDPLRTGPIFELAWTHALHCLYYTVDTYHQLTVHGPGHYGFDGGRNDDHAAHCFEYLRNQILCMSDMTLEGSASLLDATGMSQAHMCRDREHAIEWIEQRRVDDRQDIVGPSQDDVPDEEK